MVLFSSMNCKTIEMKHTAALQGAPGRVALAGSESFVVLVRKTH